MRIPPRQHLIPRVRAALTSPYSPPIYLHGPASTAKFSTLKVAGPRDAHVIAVDCILCHTDRLLFSSLLPESPAIATAPALVSALSEAPPSESLTVFVFKRAERLASSAFTASTLPLLFQLPTLCARPDIRVVLISRVPFSSLRHAHTHPLPTPPTIFFPPLSEQHLLQALQFDPSRLTRPLAPSLSSIGENYYTGFAQFVITTLYPTTNNPHHLQRVIDTLYPKYLAPFENSRTKFSPIEAFNRVRDDLTKVLTKLTPLNPTEHDDLPNGELQSSDKTQHLPKATRIFLVAAFLATVVAPAQDTRVFSTERTSRRAATQKQATNNVVPLERLLAIYHAVCPLDDQDKTPLGSTNVEVECVSTATSTAALVHLSTLVALGWLTRDSGGDQLSEPRFRCRLSRHDAGVIASTLGIPLEDYLLFDKVS